VTAIFLVGAGAVGRRAARQLAETEGVERILVTDAVPERADTVVEYLGGIAKALEWSPADALPAGVAAVAVALDGASERPIAERALEAGVPMACCSDDPQSVRGLLDLDDAAREAGVAVAAGCALAPGLSDVLARHAAGAVERVDEIHVARAGAAGPTCVSSVVRSTRGSVQEWRDGAWVRERAWSGRQLVWFPAPVGGLDCHRAASAQAALLVDAFPQLSRVSMRVAAAGGDGFKVPGLRLPKVPLPSRRGSDPEGEWGAVWVEVRGRRGRSEEILVYGAVDRMAFASGAVLAQSAAWLAGLGASPPTQTGVHGLAALVDPVPFLSELARRGVKAAAFEGPSGA
jgi:hypothetical protein